jgi:hypothetical protein
MSEAELRAVVREVLQEVLMKRSSPTPASAPTVESVRIACDADLASFVRRLIRMMDDPTKAQALRNGHHVFALAAEKDAAPRAPAVAAIASTARAGTPTAGQAIVVSGTLTEAKVKKCTGASSIVLAPGAVVTPLARDRAWALGLRIERKR